MWTPITDLPAGLWDERNAELHSLARVWKEQRQRLERSGIFERFLDKFLRRVAIETGQIERLYTLDRGVTYALIENGLDEALIPHGATGGQPATTVIGLIRDQRSAIDRVFDLVGGTRELSTSFIKQLHQLLTQHQPTTTAVDSLGQVGEVELIRGDWKRLPNNPRRADGVLHEYCPPEQVAAQMEQLLAWHTAHMAAGVSPEVEAAWLHHRFTQIHPFQDGNGRVARLLASLVLLKAGWFPLVVLDEDMHNAGRVRYIEALEQADAGDLIDLIALIAKAQHRPFRQALSLSEDVLSRHQSLDALIAGALDRLAASGSLPVQERRRRGQETAGVLVGKACEQFERAAQQIRQRFLGAGYDERQLTVRAECATDGERAGYYKQQIVQVARQLGYYANLSSSRAWAMLLLRVNGVSTHLIVSFHELGRDPTEVFAASAFAFRRMVNDETGESSWDDLQRLCEDPFTFTFQESQPDLTIRLGHWLDEALRIGLMYWQKGF
ncbi:MAG: Fic family protein [Anaerolineae bacterium]|nr:Fic family protein [Anaerolineae bacterium]